MTTNLRKLLLIPVAFALTAVCAWAYSTYQQSHTVPGFPNLWSTAWANNASSAIDSSGASGTEQSDAHEVLDQIATWIEANKNLEDVPNYNEFSYGGASGWASIDYTMGAYYIEFEIYF